MYLNDYVILCKFVINLTTLNNFTIERQKSINSIKNLKIQRSWVVVFIMLEKYQQFKFNEIYFISFDVKQHQHQ
jgi:hypothetical protein